MNITFKPEKTFVGQTIRAYLQSFFVGKAIIYKYSSSHLIRINDKAVNSEYKLKENDEITITLESVEDLILSNEPIDIIAEDDDFLVVDKPVNLLVHTDGHINDTLTSRVANYYQEKGYHHSVLPAHRIDKETSGIVVFAKHFVSLAYLSHLFEMNQVKKIYTALAENIFEKREGTIKSKLARDVHSNKMVISPYGKEAITEYRVVKNLFDKSLLDIDIQSGRTHQIRVHLSSIGHPVVGDSLYGNPSDRLMLHFKTISFKHLRTKKEVTFNSLVPF